MGGLIRKTRSVIFSLMFGTTIALAAQYGPKYFEEPKPIPEPTKKVELIGPDYCTPGIEADRHKIRIEDTIYRLMVVYNLGLEKIEKYNSGLEDLNSIAAGGTLCFPPGTLEGKL
jgi:hypothetical protein